MRILFRADGNARIGLGHVVRSLALAEMLHPLGAECWFALQAPTPAVRALLAAAPVQQVLALPAGPIAAEAAFFASLVRPSDVVVLDGYEFDLAYQQIIRATGCRLVCIDDLRAGVFVADLIINHSPGLRAAQYRAAPYTRFCLGPAFSLLRPPFLAHVALPQPLSCVESVLVCFGGADPLGLSARYAAALLALPTVQRVSLVIGAASATAGNLTSLTARFPDKLIKFYQQVSAESMVELLTGHDAVLCPASTVLIESLFLGRATITGYYADNQRRLAGYVHAHQQAHSLGDLRAGQAADLPAALHHLHHEPRRPYVRHPRPDQLRAEFAQLLAR